MTISQSGRRVPRSTARAGGARLDLAVATGSLAIGAWTYVGYPALMALLARRRRKPDLDESRLPSVTVLIPAYNEADFIVDKIRDSRALDYPEDLVEVVVVDDGSTDETAALAVAEGARVLSVPTRGGKCNALNHGIQQTTGSVIVCTDANGSLNESALLGIAREFVNPRVGFVSGGKLPSGPGGLGTGERLYWEYEDWLKGNEGMLGCTMGSDGCVYAVRRAAFQPMPDGTLADDLELPFSALRRGWLATHTSEARASEEVPPGVEDEFERRTRISAGVWQTLVRHHALLSPGRGLSAVAFATHRLFRTAVVPGLLPVTVVASARAARSSRLGKGLLALEAAFLGAAAAGSVSGHPLFGVPLKFLLTNVAALRGGVRYVRGSQSVTWTRVSRGDWVSELESEPQARGA